MYFQNGCWTNPSFSPQGNQNCQQPSLPPNNNFFGTEVELKIKYRCPSCPKNSCPYQSKNNFYC